MPTGKGPAGVNHLGSSAPSTVIEKVLSDILLPSVALITNLNSVVLETSKGVPTIKFSASLNPLGNFPEINSNLT